MKNSTEINLNSIHVNASQLKMLFNVDTGKIKTLMDGKRNVPITDVRKIMQSRVRSFDPRFDNLDIVELTINSIHEKGLPISIALKALNNKANIKHKGLTGVFSVFNSILKQSELDRITEILEYKHQYTKKYKY